MGAVHSKTTTQFSSSSMLSKFRFTVVKRLFTWRRKPKPMCLTHRREMTRHELAHKGHMKRLMRRSQTRLGSLRPMPRCSSFDSHVMLLTASSQNFALPNDVHQDIFYNQWKTKFEQSYLPLYPLAGEGLQVHDLSEALAGQLTPRGFPSHTDKRRFVYYGGHADADAKQPRDDFNVETVVIEINAADDNIEYADDADFNISVDSAKSAHESAVKVRQQHVSLRLPKVRSHKYRIARAKRQRAAFAAKFEVDLNDVQHYNGGFNYI